jgi:hypothetical protein
MRHNAPLHFAPYLICDAFSPTDDSEHSNLTFSRFEENKTIGEAIETSQNTKQLMIQVGKQFTLVGTKETIPRIEQNLNTGNPNSPRKVTLLK